MTSSAATRSLVDLIDRRPDVRCLPLREGMAAELRDRAAEGQEGTAGLGADSARLAVRPLRLDALPRSAATSQYVPA
jgi:hypothetical protein